MFLPKFPASLPALLVLLLFLDFILLADSVDLLRAAEHLLVADSVDLVRVAEHLLADLVDRIPAAE